MTISPIASLVRRCFGLAAVASCALVVGCHRQPESTVTELLEKEIEQQNKFFQLPPAKQRAKLHRMLDRAKNEDDGIHDACGELRYVGDASSVPHLIRVLRFFGDAELPLPPGVGIVCTQGHCVDTLEELTGAKVGISYSSWKRWWDTTHPEQPLDGPPNKRVNPAADAAPRSQLGPGRTSAAGYAER